MHRSPTAAAALLLSTSALSAQEVVQKGLTIRQTEQTTVAPVVTATTTVVTAPVATEMTTGQAMAVETAVTPEQATALLNDLRRILADHIASNDAHVGVNMDRIRIRIQGVDDLDSGTLGSPNHEIVDRIAAEVSRAPDWTVEVQGHSSTAPDDVQENPLAQQRAEAIAHELAEHLPNRQVSTRAMGGEHPMETNSTPEGQALNDRVEVWIMPPGYPNSTTNLYPPGEDEER